MPQTARRLRASRVLAIAPGASIVLDWTSKTTSASTKDATWTSSETSKA
jgi:hypothetical protein